MSLTTFYRDLRAAYDTHLPTEIFSSCFAQHGCWHGRACSISVLGTASAGRPEAAVIAVELCHGDRDGAMLGDGGLGSHGAEANLAGTCSPSAAVSHQSRKRACWSSSQLVRPRQ